jgi:P-type E1-E2 ATPase
MAKMMGASLDQEGFRIFQDGVETVVYLGREARVLGAVSLGDKLRETSSRALAALRASGVKTITMMTGDRRAVAVRIGEALGLRPNEIHAEMLPQTRSALPARWLLVERSRLLAMV